MKYLFILGRNVELSVAEVEAYLQKEGYSILNKSIDKNGLLIEIKETLKKDIIEEFGGVISIGEVLENYKTQTLYPGEKNNISYVVWNFSDKIDEFSTYLKKRFREEKFKATEKRFQEMGLQDGEKGLKTFSKLIDVEFFVFGNEFGRIIEKCAYEEIEKRDMEKPVRRESLSISPRLAKIMINLSQVKRDEKLVDPFCGVGVILQEALLQNIKVIGIDHDGHAIGGAQQNLEWFGFLKKDYKLIRNDSSRIDIENIDAIATEPDFGETLKKIVPKEKAENMVEKFENLMIGVLSNLKESISGRIVFTAPLIRTGKKRIGCDIESILETTGLRLVLGPFPEFRENQVVGREIYVLE